MNKYKSHESQAHTSYLHDIMLKAFDTIYIFWANIQPDTHSVLDLYHLIFPTNQSFGYSAFMRIL